MPAITPRLEPLVGPVPAAFAELAKKINELVEAHNRDRLIIGDGLVLTPSDNGRRLELATLYGTLSCGEGDTFTITLTTAPEPPTV